MGRRPIFLVVLFLAAFSVRAEELVLQLKNGEALHYHPVEDRGESARPAAGAMLRYLAAGEIEQAALLSNSPKRRYEVLQQYLASVGPDEFRRVYSQYLFPENHVVAEFAAGPRRLIIWDLGEAGHRLAAQYYVEVEGRFLMDDVPSEERSHLTELLRAYRAEKRAAETTSPARTD
jgi:hypothetical protein